MLLVVAGARDAARYVRPGQPTALLPPPAGLCAGSPPPQLLLAVPSAVANRERRDAVRATWGRALRDSSRLLFVTGHSGDGRLQEELIAEALVNGDMLVEDMVDTYDNLTVKTLLMLKWTADHCSQVSYVVKVDDDVVLNVRALSRVLAGAAERGWPLVGRLLRRPPPFRSPYHKWYVPRWLYPEDALPEYLSGPSYAVAGSALRPLLRAALKTPLLPLEDVLTTGVAADTAGLTRHDVPGLDAVPSPLWLTRPCLARASLSTGSLTAHEIRAIWDTVSRPPAGLCWLLDRLGITDHGREW
ncbi:beta-1,3-galactosyltransferase 4-like [Schistocerca nitens]|uniref:beta-1,3-galactosyltransferase 4-like n=1 Tax=Schistocerca nitens TaxID=7011 RepID=UPI0021178B70|nr:beta-1,3-galactosyltransferase 4-like [Schistocerca nitens]